MVDRFNSKPLLEFIRNEQANVSLEYALIVSSLCAAAAPAYFYYAEFVKRLFAFVGSLIR